DRHRHRLLRDHHRQKFRSALSPTAGLKPSQLPAPPAECPGPHSEAPCDLAHVRPALDLAEGALPEFALVTDDGHAPSFPRSRATREASIRGRLPASVSDTKYFRASARIRRRQLGRRERAP